jgi:DNA-binding MarR family transcriptional regulator
VVCYGVLVPKTMLLFDRPAFLIAQLGHSSSRRFGELLRPFELQPPHYGMLSKLAEQEGQTQQQLADMLGVHRNAMVGFVDELEGRGLIERRRHPMDRRAHALHLTDGAHSLLRQVDAMADEYDEWLMSSLGEQDRRKLVALLQTVGGAFGMPPTTPSGDDGRGSVSAKAPRGGEA